MSAVGNQVLGAFVPAKMMPVLGAFVVVEIDMSMCVLGIGLC